MSTPTDPSAYGPVLTAAQVAQLLSLNVVTVRNFAADGTLPASRIPGTRKWLFKLTEIMDFLDEHKNRPIEAPAVEATDADATRL